MIVIIWARFLWMVQIAVCIFMYDNIPSHAYAYGVLFEHKIFKREKIREWPPPCPNLNPIKNLQLIVKMKLYEGGLKYISQADQWEAMKTTILENDLDSLK